MSLLNIHISRNDDWRRQRCFVWWDYRLTSYVETYHFLNVFVFAIMWSVFRGRSCAPLVSQLLNMVLNWNLLFHKLWRLVTWSGHWCVFHRLEAISDNVKMTSAISVTCRENLFVKVSYLQYHALHFLTWGRQKPCLSSNCISEWVINE